MSFVIKQMSLFYYDQVYALWKTIEGMDLNPLDDNSEAVRHFLAVNPGLNYIALVDNKVVGVIMCGYDGRRATIYHAAVAKEHRGKGIGSALLERLENILKAKKITRGRLLAFKTNEAATQFWQKAGWTLQDKYNYFSKPLA